MKFGIFLILGSQHLGVWKW